MKNITISDIFIVIGLCGIAAGLWVYEPWVSPVVSGSIMLFIGLFGKK